jgi:crossover junction endodeoxyribonuclease RuvC
MSARVVAFDVSLTATGFARNVDPQSCVLRPPKMAATGMARLQWIRNRLLAEASFPAAADLVVIEGYSFNRNPSMWQLGELGGVIRLALWETGYRVLEIPPATLKKYATGKGNAKKEDVLAAAIRRLGYAGSDHNEADALWLLQIGLRYMGAPAVNVPEVHLDALKNLPPLEG